MTLRFSRIALLAGCATFAFPAFAETAPDKSEESGEAVDYGDREIEVRGDVLQSSQINSVKTPTPIIDVPQSLTITTEQDILERGFTSIGQIVDYTPGVNTSQGEGHRDAIVFRGVRSTADFFIDGVRDDVQYYRGLYNLEQIEILRGPNALLFGRGGTGGILNRVTKKGVIGETFGGGQIAVDTFGETSIQGDLNFAAGEGVAVRLNASYESLANHRDFYDGDRIGFNPTVRFELGDDTLFDLSYEYANHERFIDRGIPTGADGRPVEALEDVVFGNPSENFTTLEAHLLRANLSHQLSDGWKITAGGAYGDYDKVYSNFYASNYDPVTNIAELDGYIDTTQRENLTFSANLVGEFETGAIEHTLLIGAEYISTSSDQDRFNPEFDTSLADLTAIAGGATDTNIFGRTRPDRANFVAQRPLSFNGFSGTLADGRTTNFGFTDLNDFTQVEIDVVSLYVQDEIKLTDWLNVVVGGRFDSFDITVNNVPNSEIRTRKDEEFSPRGGIIIKPQENVSIYASYSESFLPRSGEQFANINGDNDALAPDTFTNLEAGVKWDFAQGLSLTTAIFEIEQSSPQPNDNDPATLDVIDSRIQGFELQLQGKVAEGWSISAGYSFLDGEQVSRTGPTGLRPRELPENMFSIWNNIEVSDRFGVGFGLTHQDESFIDNGNSAVLPAYTRVDAAAYFDITDQFRLQVNVENLTDTLYFPNSHATHQATVGAPLNARFAITGRF
ncbi:TonB-dependent siderophore receptor [Erythrobacter sp. F6033]|uniref:TonB-dependent receptor n=1 Tax=Erythrobacter sp. F6033 TaxID=2926401 RepID=UPI001FF2C594|nr:TonB-dependent siderophore receptor [Erythrobacter sp. F6033]MCK0129212.1 TonB-dependent siderophore receptor [Erythrobacter sp. F6033]